MSNYENNNLILGKYTVKHFGQKWIKKIFERNSARQYWLFRPLLIIYQGGMLQPKQPNQ